MGVRGDYRRLFWRTALSLLRRGRVEELVHLAAVSHHLVTFAREVAAGTAEKSFYSAGSPDPIRSTSAAGPHPEDATFAVRKARPDQKQDTTWDGDAG